MKTMRRALYSVLLFTTFLSCQNNNHSVSLAWTASLTPNVTYNMYRGAQGAEVLIKTGITGTTFTDTGLTANTQFCYFATAINAATKESVPSNEVCTATDKDQALPPGSLVITSHN